MVITRHAKNRLKERAGLSPSVQEKTAELAYEIGLQHGELPKGALKRFIDKQYISYPLEFSRGSQMRVYRNCVWVFRGQTLITVLSLPSRFHKLVKALQGQKDAKNGHNN